MAQTNASSGPQTSAAMAELRVSDNGRFLIREDGSPFFYLGDTAWELFHRLSREEADRYLADRADEGVHGHPGGGHRRVRRP